MIKIVHISDLHGKHEELNIPECDVLICSGDVGNVRTTLNELNLFLIWFEKQPARLKIFVAGNHDVLLDKYFAKKQGDSIAIMLAEQKYQDAKKLIEAYNIKYLEDKDYCFEGIKFYGSPYSPSFGDNWGFNADRGNKIKTIWGKIPSDVDVLITHTPVYKILDKVEDKQKRYPDEDTNVGCQDLLNVIKKRLTKLKLHCSGHIHEQYGVVHIKISNTRSILFSNGAVVKNEYDKDQQPIICIKNPLLITL